MARAVSVRLDDDALRALSQLEAVGMTQSEAIRISLVHEAARMRARRSLAVEVAALEADEADRAEMTTVAGLMEQLRAPG
ncbi:MAG: hypothetical protein F4Z54_00070 [Acidimicrobiaceae bacterium]|nr:hypothetical protein [Acidimicrobiaceae bacterium]MYE55891.1 hypothetical protein [Acidimicrobiaceae bacterium]MYI15555.1 hypothetical protein [Acidimicrobiaceae bacterium]